MQLLLLENNPWKKKWGVLRERGEEGGRERDANNGEQFKLDNTVGKELSANLAHPELVAESYPHHPQSEGRSKSDNRG